MPKEYVSSAPQERGSVKVTWGRECGDVQIAVAGPTGWRDNYRVTSINPDEALDWHFNPSRDELNKLIRILRHARDQSFGRDE